MSLPPVEILHFHLFCGLGGGAAGFNRASARVGSMSAKYRCIGGIDVDPASIHDFGRLAGVPGTVLDLFDRDQYRAFHGREPGPDWREATPADIQRAAGGERPHIVFLSAPCKGFSGLLSETMSRTGRYQALNRLTLRGVWLMLEAWGDDPPEFILFENVPRIATRGRALLDQIVPLLRHYGYAVAETTHDCGELGGLAQSRKRFLLVARHAAKVPPFLYEPTKRRLRGVGEVLERFPMPGDRTAGPMHRMPALQWRTWVRLAFVEAGSDWRSLNRLRVEDGHLADFRIEPGCDWHSGILGVRRWDQSSGTVTGSAAPTTGTFAVADPRRSDGRAEFGQYGVKGWGETGQTVTGKAAVGAGAFSVADPRVPGNPYNHVYRIVPWGGPAPTVISANAGTVAAVADPRAGVGRDGGGKYRVTSLDEPAGTVIAASTTGQGAFAVADPRTGYGPNSHRNKLAVVGWDRQAGTITGSDRVGSGALSVADPRPAAFRDGKADYQTGGHYGVVPWEATAGAVTASGQHDNGRWSVADPRPVDGDEAPALPAPDARLVAVIRALDDTWHRPFTTLELAALQSLVDPEEHLELHGLSDSAWRERIGNAVPRDAAQAIGSVIGRTLLLAWAGETFALSSEPIWVQPIALAAAVNPATWIEGRP